MINFYNKNRFVSKHELAKLAGVSDRTFCRYLKSRRHILDAMGVDPHARLLPPQAVKYLCEDYCIDLPEELQDERALRASTLYQNLIRELQKQTFFDGQWTKVTEIPPNF